MHFRQACPNPINLPYTQLQMHSELQKLQHHCLLNKITLGDIELQLTEGDTEQKKKKNDIFFFIFIHDPKKKKTDQGEILLTNHYTSYKLSHKGKPVLK